MITFTANSKTYTRKDVEAVDLFHYRKADFSILQASEGARSFFPHEDAEIVLRYSNTGGEPVDADISKTTLRCTHRAPPGNYFLGLKTNVLLPQWHTVQTSAIM